MSSIINDNIPALSLDDVTIVPASESYVKSRNECNARWDDGKLPVFVSPMDSIINESNFDLFNKDFHSIYPRTLPIARRIELLEKGNWVAFGLKEIDDLIKNIKDISSPIRICIDQANGHMHMIIEKGQELRKCLVEGSEIMIGNIANPSAMYPLIMADFADWVRVGIGGGSACTTSVQTGVHYPMATLINKCCDKRKEIYKYDIPYPKHQLKIIADGGIKNSGDICKCLALGADAVMCGGFLCACEESASQIISIPTEKGIVRWKEYWGMSTKHSQKNMGDGGSKNSEGVMNMVRVDCTLEERVFQIESSIKSAMSYCGCFNLKEFNTRPLLTRITSSSFASYDKEIQNV